MFSLVLDFLLGILRRYLPLLPNSSTHEALVKADGRTPAPSSWLNKDALDQFIARGSMETYEKDLHEAGETLLLKLVERLLLHPHEGDDFIINVNERMVKGSSLEISSCTDRRIFEFEMTGRDKSQKRFVGKQFMLIVRGRKGEKEEDRKRNIRDGYKRVLREFHIWNKLRASSSFVQLLHMSFDDGKSITAVLESFRGDLRQSLSTPGIDFTTIIKGIAKGLDFLHKFTENIPINGLQNEGGSREEKVTGIAHSDVKCANVFLREGSSIPYLADFGVSHQVIDGSFTRMFETSGINAIGTLHWMPPELLKLPVNVTTVLASDSDDKLERTRIVTYTTESDLWSFGMTIHEIVSRNDPWEEITSRTKIEDIPEKIKEAMKNADLPNWPAATDDIAQPLQKYSDSLRYLRNQCCKYDPNERLKMKQVVDKLDEIFAQ